MKFIAFKEICIWHLYNMNLKYNLIYSVCIRQVECIMIVSRSREHLPWEVDVTFVRAFNGDSLDKLWNWHGLILQIVTEKANLYYINQWYFISTELMLTYSKLFFQTYKTRNWQTHLVTECLLWMTETHFFQKHTETSSLHENFSCPVFQIL